METINLDVHALVPQSTMVSHAESLPCREEMKFLKIIMPQFCESEDKVEVLDVNNIHRLLLLCQLGSFLDHFIEIS